MYDVAIGRFMVNDRFSDKYYDLSPYQYGANNPIKYIDVNGDSINLAALMANDIMTSINIMLDLSEQTGLSLTVKSNGNLTYAKNSKTGKALVADVDGVQSGSKSARNFLTGLIDNESTISVGPNKGGGSKTPKGGNRIWMDSERIEGHIHNTPKD